MAKYRPEDIPPGESKPINQMTREEYASWRGRCGGRSRSKNKLKALKKAQRAKRPGLTRYHELVKEIAKAGYTTPTEVMLLSDDDYQIDDVRAGKLLAAAAEYRERNPI